MKTSAPAMSDLSWLNPTPHAISHTPCNRCVRFAAAVASGHATLATKRTLLLTWAGLAPAGSHQLCLAHVAVGTCVSSHAPRTEPYVRLARIRLPPWVFDGEAVAWPWMSYDRFGKPEVRQLRHPRPREAILLAASPERTPP